MTVLALDADRDGQRRCQTARSVLELDRHLRKNVGPTTAAPHSAAEELVAEEDREEIGDVGEIELRGPEATRAQALVPESVVEVARLRLREDLVRLGRFSEAVLGVQLVRDVGVELSRESPEG
jgi:hypothetical protein